MSQCYEIVRKHYSQNQHNSGPVILCHLNNIKVSARQF